VTDLVPRRRAEMQGLESPHGADGVGIVAALAVAAQRAKQAQAACRTAAQRLAQAQDGADVYAQRTCATARDLAEVAEVAALALAEHGRVDVVVLVSP
jgi:NAD(P)-dependent dehydrogenase (short-subunit alcohol dehydrogenase family)